MKKEDIAIISEYLNDDEPFGPVDAKEIKDPKVIEILFEHHNEIYKSLHKKPSIIIGRRGSGKTSYLYSVYFEKKYKYIVEVNAATAFLDVIKAISSFTTGISFAEIVAEVWENILYIGLFSSICSKLPSESKAKKLIKDYLAKIGTPGEETIDTALWQMVNLIAEYRKSKPSGMIADMLRRLDNVTFKKTKLQLIEDLNGSDEKAVILLDNLEEFHLQMQDVGRALQGLLKFAGESNKPNSPIDIRLCLPAEQFHQFSDISSNPGKDFKRKVLLHWVASELAVVAAHRYSVYRESIGIPTHLEGRTSTEKKKYAKIMLEQILPKQIENKLGSNENPLAYIMRHTQLLPRQLLMILNSIHSYNKQGNGKGTFPFTETSIRKGISAAEPTIVKQIFHAFKPVHPKAENICEQCIPELFMTFSLGDLEKVFRTHGKTATESDDFSAFKRALIEIGIVGRFIKETDRYIQAEFEYTLHHKLVTGTDDLLCIHPLFAEQYSAKIREKKPIYPYGSRIDDRDFRDY